jgi:hypothetical protein
MYFSTVTLNNYETIMLISTKFSMEAMSLKVPQRYISLYLKYKYIMVIVFTFKVRSVIILVSVGVINYIL